MTNSESRQTFRSQQTITAWQYQIRKQKELEWQNSGRTKFWESIDCSLKNARVKNVSRETAQKIILDYEWLGDMAVTNQFYGIFFGDYCGGVICINTSGAGKDSHIKFGIERRELAYFARGACAFWTPKGSASKLLSFALKFEKQRGAKVAMAFADTDAGEYGTVYQATNWLCLGRGAVSKQWFKGTRVLDTRTFCSYAKRMNVTTTAYAVYLRQNGWIEQPSNAKYRYAFIMADEPDYSRIYNNIHGIIKPYPKRPQTEVTNGT